MLNNYFYFNLATCYYVLLGLIFFYLFLFIFLGMKPFSILASIIYLIILRYFLLVFYKIFYKIFYYILCLFCGDIQLYSIYPFRCSFVWKKKAMVYVSTIYWSASKKKKTHIIQGRMNVIP